MSRERADVLLFKKGLVDSREKGKRVIMQGTVYIGEERVEKPGERYDSDVEIYIKENPIKFVSRGGHKLEKAIEEFDIDLEDVTAMDIGASTGGFTDCMLKYGARKIYAVDVGYGQLDWQLRNDERVEVMERTNIRYVTKEDLGEELDFAATDVSFISLKLVLPVINDLLKEDGEAVVLVKPQFEAGREQVGKNGIVRDKKIHIEVLEDIVKFAEKENLKGINLSYSPITGAKGNIEFILHLKKSGNNLIDNEYINNIVDQAHKELK